jgi:hypothetical protein
MTSPLADLTHYAIQAHNTTPQSLKSKYHCHNPYAFSVLPLNHTDLPLKSLGHFLDVHRGDAFSRPLSPLILNSTIPLQHQEERSSLPFSCAPLAGLAITKMYVDGRPIAVASHPQKPTSPEPLVPSAVVRVAFRRSEREFHLRDTAEVFGHPCSASFMMGKYVIVDGDRGQDLGRIVSVSAFHEVPASGTSKLLEVKRSASIQELDRYEALRQDELKAVEYARHQSNRLFGLSMVIEDAEFQFDKQKLTLWYRVPERIYFVPLLKALNHYYRCRIWMERVEDAPGY